MSKKFQIALTLVALMAIMLTATVSAQYTGYTWATTYQVVNMGDAAATITVDYYAADGTSPANSQQSFTLDPGKSKVVVQLKDDKNLGSGRYSAVISSNQPIAAVVNQQVVSDADAAAGNMNSTPPFASYSGASAGATSVTLPEIMYNWYGYYTEIIVQNVGGGTASNISIAYTPTTIGGVVAGATGQSDTIASLAQYAFSVTPNKAEAKLGATSGTFVGRFLGSATVTSAQSVVVIVNQHNEAARKLLSYNGFGPNDASLTTFVPQHLRGWYGYFGSLLIANPSTTTAANVTLTYTPDKSFSQMAAVSEFAVTQSIPAGSSINRYDGSTASAAQSDLVTKGIAQFIGGVKIVSDIPVVVKENLETPKQAGAYNGITSESGTLSIVVPLIQADFYNFYTSLNVQNISATDATCTFTYYSDDTYSSVKNTSKAYTHAIKGNATITVYENGTQGDVHMDPTTWTSAGNRRFIGSATIVCDQKVVAFVNSESNSTSANIGDSLYTFNAFNK